MTRRCSLDDLCQEAHFCLSYTSILVCRAFQCQQLQHSLFPWPWSLEQMSQL
jgi:hypothetical protein